MLSIEGSWNPLPKQKCSPFADVWRTSVKLSKCCSYVPICTLFCPETKTFGLQFSALSLLHLTRPESMQPAMLWQNIVHTLVPSSPPPRDGRRAFALCLLPGSLLGGQPVVGGAVRASLSTSWLLSCTQRSLRAALSQALWDYEVLYQ